MLDPRLHVTHSVTKLIRRKPSSHRSRQLMPLRNDGAPKQFKNPPPRVQAKRDGRTFGTTIVGDGDDKVIVVDYTSGECSRCGVYGMVGSVTAAPENRTCKDGCKASDLARAQRRIDKTKDRKKTAKSLKPITHVSDDPFEPDRIITTGERVRADRNERRWQARAEHVRNALAQARSSR